MNVYKIDEDVDYKKTFRTLSTFEKSLKTNNISLEKDKDMLESPDFEQEFYSKNSSGLYQIGHDSIRLMKTKAYYDRFQIENINYYDLMGPILKFLNEIS